MLSMSHHCKAIENIYMCECRFYESSDCMSHCVCSLRDTKDLFLIETEMERGLRSYHTECVTRWETEK